MIKTVIGHMCGNVKDIDYQVKTLVKLIQEGYSKKLFLSHDTVNSWLGRDVSGFYKFPGTKEWKVTRIGDYILPKLKEKGISDDQMDQILITNIQNLFK